MRLQLNNLPLGVGLGRVKQSGNNNQAFGENIRLELQEQINALRQEIELLKSQNQDLQEEINQLKGV
ncbi:hypothetical protein HPU229334_00990 [Helicobacter pullorum]|uniref:Uncharacterized protein n=1 Tax=Helicobacter pullorum TaxID=35818 RepID=A0A0N1EIB0_9HELI|nr:hypothetical protein [Helicobacter pullorum]KAB0574562.1 hypothetical protein F7P74_06405 [Helicobacter pullorum NCTC 12824]KPH53285.1 hypothetical protein HPU229334_00990 [Helicobacter pullorum]